MDVKSLLGRVGGNGNVKSEPQCPVCIRPFYMETTTSVSKDKETSESITRVCMTPRALHNDRGGGPKDSRGWFDTLDDMEVQVLVMCGGTSDIQDMMDKYIGDNEDDDDKYEDDNYGEEKGK